ncbi:hypothetical protein PRK78_003056 [Emydomyces testavorans]|uniref:Plastocyanin-like domain-containing protein n=1 Tax=Emydomyces testavorans TaxID=2070801 RepID=A0AAF0DG80_9EURO|nr:hypothetical protein PRK78_003056 [Emydomyces testavorans]
MERPASRRRHQPSETEETKDGDAEEEEKKKKKKKTSVSLLPTILYAAILVLFLRLLGFHLSPLLSDNNKHSSPSPLSPLSPLGFELHPQEHIYRPPATIRLNWTITSAYRRPDGVKKRVYLINGELLLYQFLSCDRSNTLTVDVYTTGAFPGPTVETRPGDRLLINVTNELQHEGVSLHWHGLHMRGEPSLDPLSPFASSTTAMALV